MPEKRYNLGEKSRRVLIETVRRVRAGDGSSRPVPTRRTPRGGGGRGEVLRVLVNQPVGVASGDPTFPFHGAIGQTAPVDGTGTGYNIYQQTYAHNDVVWLFWNKELQRWETERGGTAGSQLIYFELTEDKSYSHVAKLAKPVDAAGAIITGADAFYVVDDQNQFYGKAAVGAVEGYRGFAWKYTDDYTAGVPGWRIITMEGPAQLMVVALDQDYSLTGTDCLPLVDEPWGRPLRGRRLPDTGVIVVQDDLDVASNAKDGDKWLIAWDEEDEHYIFLLPLKPRLLADVPATAMITGTVPAMATIDGATYDATPGISATAVGHIVKFDSVTVGTRTYPIYPPEYIEDADFAAMKVINRTKTDIIGTTGVPLLYDGAIVTCWDAVGEAEVLVFAATGPHDIRSIPNFDPAVAQIEYHEASSHSARLDAEDCP